jgi:carboxymethylenebutenolidase
MTDVDFPASTGTLPGYLAVPGGGGPWPAVVVVHEILGLTDDVRRQADRVAAAGYLALAPDLFGWGATPRCLAATLLSTVRGHGRALDDVNAARRYLAARDDCTGTVGILGFCLGGGIALLVSPDGFAAAAPSYGDLPRDAEQRLRAACPVVGSYGGSDRMLPGRAARLERLLTDVGVPHDVKEYPGATHGFMYPHTGKAAWTGRFLRYDADAAEDAWRRIIDFFDTHLRKDRA